MDFAWDARNRLIAVTNFANSTDADAQQNATQAVEYVYDLNNRRIGRTVDEDGDGSLEVNERFVWSRFDGNVIFDFADQDADGAVEGDEIARRYLWGPGVDELLAQETIVAAGQDVGDVREP